MKQQTKTQLLSLLYILVAIFGAAWGLLYAYAAIHFVLKLW